MSDRLPASIFISYASEDTELVGRLCAKFRKTIEKVWMDRPEIDPGDEWQRKIRDGLLQSQIVIAVLTRRSVMKESYWIRWEQGEARRLFRPVIPVKLEPVPIPEHLRHIQYADLTRDWDGGFLELRNAIRKQLLRFVPGSTERFRDYASWSARPFVGREREIRDVFELLETNVHAIETQRTPVAIQGMGGTGKTLLAEELLRRLRIRYPGGATVETRGKEPEPSPAEEVFQEWAWSIKKKYPDPKWTAFKVQAELRERYGQILVLIDDVWEEDFRAVEELLGALPLDTSILITTRFETIKGYMGSELYSLPDLSHEDAMEMAQRRLTGKDGGKVDEEVLTDLYEAVGGHALSLELAIGRCTHTGQLRKQVATLRQSLARGEIDKLALRAVGTTDERGHSVAANLKASLDSLESYDDENQTDLTRRFRALGIVPEHGRMDLAMLAVLWGDDPDGDVVDEAHASLHERALLNYGEGQNVVVVLHPVVRSYAFRLLLEAPDEFDEVRQRYIAFVASIAENELRKPQREWSRLKVYRPHIFQVAIYLFDAFRKSVGPISQLVRPEAPDQIPQRPGPEATTEAEISLRFADAVQRFVILRPEMAERGEKILRLGLASARVLSRQDSEVEYLDALGQWFEKRDPQLASSYYDAGLRTAKGVDARALEATLLSHKGELQRTRNKPTEAMTLLKRALIVHQEFGNVEMQAATLRSMGETYWRLGLHDKATELHGRALEIYRAAGKHSGVGDMYNKLGSVEFNKGNKREAIEYFQKALKVHREVENRSMEAEDLNDMGVAHTYLGEQYSALRRLVSALIIHRELENHRLGAMTRCNLAHTYIRLELYEPAKRIADAALEITGKLEDALVAESWANCWKGVALRKLGKLEEARPFLEKALEQGRRAKNPRGVAGHLGHLADLYRDLGKPDEALDYLRQALVLLEEKELDEAFGGRRPADIRAMIAEIEAGDANGRAPCG